MEYLPKLNVFGDQSQISTDFGILIIQNIFSDHREFKPEISYKKVIRKFSKVLELNAFK